MSVWTVAISCCCINFLLLGVAKLSPLLFVASMERYNASRQEASLPFVLSYSMRMLCGPLAGFLGDKIGLMLTTIVGCVASSLGIGLCFFAESIIGINILWGCVYGLGMGFACGLLSAILSLHFKENYTKANGLAYFGSSLGTLVLPPLVEVILKCYGISGTFLILGGLTLNSIASAILLKIPITSKKAKERKEKVIDVAVLDNQESCKSDERGDHKTEIGAETSAKAEISGLTMHGYTNNSIDLKEESKSTIRNVFLQTIPMLKDKFVSKLSPERSALLTVKRFDDNSSYHLANVSSLEHKDIPNTTTLKETEKPEAFKSKLGSFHIFCDPTYFLIVLTQGIFGFGVVLVWTIVIDYVRDKGVERSKEIYFLVFPQFADMIGKLGLGFLIDGGYMTQTGYCVSSYFLMGVSLCCLVWSKSFFALMMSLFMFSFITGGIVIGLPGVVTSYMKSEYLSMAMASRSILCAPFTLAISPLIGFFRGKLNSYDGLLYLSSALCLVCCVLILLIPPLAKRRDKKHIEMKK